MVGDQDGSRIAKKNGVGWHPAMLSMLMCWMIIGRKELPPSLRADLGLPVEDISESDAWTNRRCRQSDFPRLFNALRFAERVVCSNDSDYSGETVSKGRADSRGCSSCCCARTALEEIVPTNPKPLPLVQQDVYTLQGPSGFPRLYCFCARTPLEGSSRTNPTPPPLVQQQAVHAFQ